MNQDQPADLREETMLYREPTSDSEDSKVQDIWGKRLETRVVDADDVAGLMADGWVTHPLHVGKKPEEIEGFVQDRGKAGEELDHTRLALETAEKLADEQAKEIAELRAQCDKIAADLQAAEELADAETKAKEAALAEVQALKDKQSKPPGKGS